jgi:type IV pilus assembly protein PilX
MRKQVFQFKSRANQKGAVLFVGLMILVLLALIGVAGMQGTILQERMSGNYRTQNVAFQNAEAGLRALERTILVASRAGNVPTVDQVNCTLFETQSWVDTRAGTTATWSRKLNRCIPGFDSLQTGRRVNDNPNDIYGVTSVSSENAGASGLSTSAVETIYIP